MSTAASQSVSDPPWLIVVMGVSGCGKSSVGESLAASLGVRFVEGDALHPPANVDKMARGIPLSDDDRWPWLDRIGIEIVAAREVGLVISCSALKRIYRDRLRKAAGERLNFVFLLGTRELLERRMTERHGHFMPASLLDSQLATVEDPSAEPGVVAVDIARTLEDVVGVAIRRLAQLGR